jgi:glycosyltransferase involved in cell wall biosynthesis
MMHILYLCSTFYPVIGGAETYALNLAHGLGEIGHIVQIVTDRVEGQAQREQIAENVSVLRIDKYCKGFNAPDRILWEHMQFGLCDEIKEIVEEFSLDIIISNSLDLCILAKLVSLHTQKPWVATFHEQAPERESFGDARLRLAYEILQPNAVIAGSQFYFTRACHYGNINKCHLIYHGINVQQFQFKESRSEVYNYYKIPINHSLIVSAGRLKSRKGFTDLIHAVSILRERGWLVTALIAGSLNSASSGYREELKSLTDKLDLTNEIIFDEVITHDQMPWLLSSSDIVVQASIEEGLGLAVIEAMACERPVVTTRIPGITEIVTSDDIAMLVEPQDPQDLANAIDILLANSELRRSMGMLSRKHIVEHFSLERMSSETSQLIKIIHQERG